MFRVIVYLLITVFLITVIRAVVGVVTKAVSEALRGAAPTPTNDPRNVRSNPAASVPLTGELKRDPVCGTYTSASSSLQHTSGGETFYFCSKECSDKFVASKRATA
jgi:YHS domain-containing protein